MLVKHSKGIADTVYNFSQITYNQKSNSNYYEVENLSEHNIFYLLATSGQYLGTSHL